MNRLFYSSSAPSMNSFSLHCISSHSPHHFCHLRFWFTTIVRLPLNLVHQHFQNRVCFSRTLGVLEHSRWHVQTRWTVRYHGYWLVSALFQWLASKSSTWYNWWRQVNGLVKVMLQLEERLELRRKRRRSKPKTFRRSTVGIIYFEMMLASYLCQLDDDIICFSIWHCGKNLIERLVATPRIQQGIRRIYM